MTYIIQNRIVRILYNDRDFSGKEVTAYTMGDDGHLRPVTFATCFVLFRAMQRQASRLISKKPDISNQVKQLAMTDFDIIRKDDRLLYEYIRGSHLYGITNESTYLAQ